jgi:hypothetical protein
VSRRHREERAREREHAARSRNVEWDDRLKAYVDMVGRTGSVEFQFRWEDSVEPMVFIACSKHELVNTETGDKRDHYVFGCGTEPLAAVFMLLESLMDGGICTHCHKPTGVHDDFSEDMPLPDYVCWFSYDPELKKVRRGCEGDDRTG